MTLYNSRPDFSILLIPYHKLLLFFYLCQTLFFRSGSFNRRGKLFYTKRI